MCLTIADWIGITVASHGYKKKGVGFMKVESTWTVAEVYKTDKGSYYYTLMDLQNGCGGMVKVSSDKALDFPVEPFRAQFSLQAKTGQSGTYMVVRGFALIK